MKQWQLFPHVETIGGDGNIIEGGIEVYCNNWNSIEQFISKNNINCEIQKVHPKETNDAIKAEWRDALNQ